MIANLYISCDNKYLCIEKYRYNKKFELHCRKKLIECMLKLSLEGFVSIYEKNTFRILAGPDT